MTPLWGRDAPGGYIYMTPDTLKGARAALNMTQARLAMGLRISTRQYIRYEMGHTEIPGPVALLIEGWTTGRWPKLQKAHASANAAP